MSITPSPAYRDRYAAAGWTCAVFIAVNLFDGWLKIALVHGTLLHYWIFDLVKWLALPALLMVLLHRNPDVRRQDYGLTDTRVVEVLALLPLVLITLFVAFYLPDAVSRQLLGGPKPPFSAPDTLAALGRFWIVGSLYFSVTAGLWESIFIIGLPWLWFSRAEPQSLARTTAFVAVLSLLFALGHWENGVPNIIGAFVFEVCAVCWYLRLRTLWPIIVAHALIDLYDFWP